ncbi:Inhibitor of Bruton tyrosine kinase-like [Homarus americanus]|uniref:Inhibitor of Bruton tyrosine kinase-like n=1 Tax=Homarus americanus TaxID=6706 RepID=A0A8J5JJE2_HOMAM|nr:Inhibitor of Bruton tyrosine kinase-like [Homarus americanus]
MSRALESNCTSGCRSRKHGSLITAAIIRGSEAQAISYTKNLCQRCCFVSDETGKTALHTAASCGKRKVVKWLLSKGASVNQRDWESGYTPLHRALFYGHLHVACALIQAGGNLSTLDHDALTPLDHANFDRLSTVSFNNGLSKRVYVWGNNTNYNLGQANQHARGTPECLDSLHREGDDLKDVAMSKFHTLFLGTGGRVYACGHGQGGRLGLDTNSPVITPRLVKAFLHETIEKVAVGPDHSLFLNSLGQVWSCGTNLYHQLGLNPPPEHVYTPRLLTWHKSHKENIEGIAAAKYHSVMWTHTMLYTFGLNAGQLGHFKNANERTIVIPRQVTSVVLNEKTRLVSVGASDGATVLSTSSGDIYVLHQYQIRKVASRLCGVSKVACVGGHLDSKIGADGLIEHGGDDLKIAVLTGNALGHLYFWTAESSQLSRCTFSINRELILSDFCLGRHCIGIVTDKGEAFSAVVLPLRERKTSDKLSFRRFSGIKGQVLEFHDRSTYFTLRITRIAALHRTTAIMCDPKGLNFAALQLDLSALVSNIPQVCHSTAVENFGSLLKEANELDTIHDVVIVCGTQRFPAHSYILASHSGYFCRQLINERGNLLDEKVDVQKVWGNTLQNSGKKLVILHNIQPDVFQEVLTFIYTGSCKFTDGGCNRNGPTNDQLLDDINSNTPVKHEWTSSENLNQRSAYSLYKEEAECVKTTNRQKKKKGQRSTEADRMLHTLQTALSVAKKLEIPLLEKELLDIRQNMDECIQIGEKPANRFTVTCKEECTYSREKHQELWDVMIRSKNGEVLGAHKCILAAKLEYFHCMFGASWMETTASKSLEMPLPTNILSIILDYLYEDKSPKLIQCRDPEFVCNVLAVADQFLITRLRELCESVLSELLTLKNVAELLEFSVTYNALQLKTIVMEYICLNIPTLLENGSLLSISNSDILVELSEYYRELYHAISYRMITPYDHPPYADELEQMFEEKPFTLPESDEEWDDISSVKGEKALSFAGGSGSTRKKKRQHRNSQGDGRSRKISSSSVSSSDCDITRDLEEDFETLDFNDLQERVLTESPSGESNNCKPESVLQSSTNTELVCQVQMIHENSSWQKVCKKKSTVGHSALLPIKSRRESLNQESPAANNEQSCGFPGRIQACVMETSNRETSLPKFPSLQDSMELAQKNAHLPKNSKMGKLSQKQRKKLAAESAASEESTKRVQCFSRSISAPAWGTTNGAIVTANAITGSQTLADIMKAEEAKLKKSSPPVPIQSNKRQSGSGTPSKRGFSWGKDEISADNQSVIEKECNGLWSVVASSPPVSPVDGNLPSPGHKYLEKHVPQSPPQLPAVPSFFNILLEEETHSDNLMREQSKPLGMIQV